MQFGTWLENLEEPIILLNRDYLFDRGMSGARVRGEIVQAMEEVRGTWARVNAGQLGVLLDQDGHYFNIAVNMGMFGFQPIRSEARFWSKTGVFFDGDEKKLARMSDEEMQIIPMVRLKPVEDQLRQYPQVTQVFVSERQMRAILYTPPKGPSGYRSDYQIIINNDKPGLLQVLVVIKGKTKVLNTDEEGLPKAVQAAVMFIAQNRD